MPKLPRALETDPHRDAIERALSHDLKPLWGEGTAKVAHLPLTPALAAALAYAGKADHLARGLEKAEQTLVREAKGLQAARDKDGSAPADRISRLLVLANDGAERFYRDAEQLLRHHADRLVVLRLDATSAELGAQVFGEGKVAKALLVADKDAVGRVLVALA